MNSLGFSLLELLIVMIITAILSYLGINSWQDLRDRNQLSVVTHNLIAFLNEIKREANLYNENLHIHFIKQTHYDWCLVVKDGDTQPSTCLSKLHFIPKYKAIEFYASTTNSMFVFYGKRSTAKAVTIRLKNRVGETRVIISVPGRIRSCSYLIHLDGFLPC